MYNQPLKDTSAEEILSYPYGIAHNYRFIEVGVKENVERKAVGWRVAFPYDERLIAQIKRIPGRSFNSGSKEWEIPLTAENARMLRDFVLPYEGDSMTTDELIWCYIVQRPKKIKEHIGEKPDEMPFPTTWTRKTSPYVAILSLSKLSGKIERDFIGTKVNFNSKGNNADVEYSANDIEQVRKAKVVEIRSGGRRDRDRSYFVQKEDGLFYEALSHDEIPSLVRMNEEFTCTDEDMVDTVDYNQNNPTEPDEKEPTKVKGKSQAKLKLALAKLRLAKTKALALQLQSQYES